MDKEPAVILGMVGTAVASVLALLVAFFVPITADQQKAILGVVGGVGPLVIALLIRQQVTPEARALARERAALERGRAESIRQVDLEPPTEEG